MKVRYLKRIHLIILLLLIFPIILGQKKAPGIIGSNIPRKLEYSNYITVKYKRDASYEKGFNYYNFEYRKEISYIIYENKNYNQSQSLSISSGKSIDIHFSYPIKSLEKFFDGFDVEKNNNCIMSIDFSHFDSSKLENVAYMLFFCNNLESIDFTNFTTTNIKNMSHMFSATYALKSIDVSSFNTSLVEDMQNMFGSCNSLESLDLSNFDTSSVKDMKSMFRQCTNLKSLDLSILILHQSK